MVSWNVLYFYPEPSGNDPINSGLKPTSPWHGCFLLLMATRNPVNSPVELGSLSIPLVSRGFSTIPGSPPRWWLAGFLAINRQYRQSLGCHRCLQPVCLVRYRHGPVQMARPTGKRYNGRWGCEHERGDEQHTLGYLPSNSGKWRLIRISWWWLLLGGQPKTYYHHFLGERIKHEYQIYLFFFWGDFFVSDCTTVNYHHPSIEQANPSSHSVHV